MRTPWILAAVLAAALLAPALAHAGVTMRVVPLDGGRALASAPGRFDMLAFKGRGTILFRAHRLRGGWTAWQAADDDPTWVGDADRFQERGGTGVRAYEIWSPVEGAPARQLSEAGSPVVISRAAWKADEEIVRGHPAYAPRIQLAVVHHTANANGYTPAQAAAIVRGIETYHVQGNGWNDIGYNFLVDRFGNVYEGRAGGIERNVIGAHAEGFNTGTVGVALIGNFTTTAPSAAMRAALVRLLAWRLDLAHVDPLSTVAYTSGGNAKFRAGKVVTLRAISGHRDTGPTECPGTSAYRTLDEVAKEVAATGLPKLYAPTVTGALGGPIRFQARLSSSLAWTVTVADATGHVTASAKGTGATVDWTWRSPPTAAKAGYTWTISAPGIRVASGTLGKAGAPPPPAAPTITGLAADTSSVSFSLGIASTIDVHVADATGATVLPLAAGTHPSGQAAITWDSTALAPGRYRVVVVATANGKSVTKWVDLTIDRTVTAFAAAAGPGGTTTFSFTLAASVPVRLEIDDGAGDIVAELYQGTLPAGSNTVSWDGNAYGRPLPPGQYAAVLTVTDDLGLVPFSIPLTLPAPPG